MLKILIADDEELARQKIKMFLEGRDDILEIAEARNGYEALIKLNSIKPDLIFLDIEMPEMSGFEFLAKAGDLEAAVIFTTAYDKYAVRAFEVNAADYLLKPFTIERFNEALNRVAGRDKKENHLFTGELLKLLQETLAKKPKYLTRLTVKKGNRYIIMNTDEIILLEAEGNYLKIVTESARYLHRSTLSAFEESLDPDKFIRIHRSVIVKKDSVKEIEPKFNNEFVIILSNGMKTTSSRNYYSSVKELIS